MDERASRAGTDLPEPHEVGRAVGRAESWFRRTLPAWASDVLMLRHSGVIHPSWPDGEADGFSYAA